MEVSSALETAIENEIVRFDIESGNAWWVSRLLVLCADTLSAGAPKVLVFVGMKNCSTGTFLGWAEPSILLSVLRETSIVRDNVGLLQPVKLAGREI